MSQRDPHGCSADRDRRPYEFLFSDGQRLPAGQSRVSGHVRDRDGGDRAQESRADEDDREDREDDRRKCEHAVRDPHEDVVDATMRASGEQPGPDSEDAGRRDGRYRAAHGDARTVEDAAQLVAPDLIEPEHVLRGRALPAQADLLFDRVVRGHDRRERRESDDRNDHDEAKERAPITTKPLHGVADDAARARRPHPHPLIRIRGSITAYSRSTTRLTSKKMTENRKMHARMTG